MKKLNITKERFEKSRYFKNKYGKLEYVSESGKLFKTSKGKVLMFKEAKGIRRSGKKTLVGFSDDNWLGIPGVVDSDDVIIYKGNEVPKGDLYEYLADDFPEFADLEGDEEEAWLRAHKKEVKEMIRDMAWAYDEYEESSKKFGKKFNESDDEIEDAVQDAYDKYRACMTEPKVCQAIKINADGTEKKIGIWMDRDNNSIGGIVKAIRDGRLRKVLKFSESSKPKFVKESTDIENEDEVWNKWERMSDEITSALNIEQVAKSVARKYFPRKANEIANWINENIELICTTGYGEDWTDLNRCLYEFTDDTDIQISDLA